MSNPYTVIVDATVKRVGDDRHFGLTGRGISVNFVDTWQNRGYPLFEDGEPVTVYLRRGQHSIFIDTKHGTEPFYSSGKDGEEFEAYKQQIEALDAATAERSEAARVAGDAIDIFEALLADNPEMTGDEAKAIVVGLGRIGRL